MGNTMLVLCGQTYTSRLWCVVELYVFVKMRMEKKSQRENMILKPLCESTWDTWDDFDVRNCQCFDVGDKARIMLIFEQGIGLDGFNGEVQRLMREQLRASSMSGFLNLLPPAIVNS